MFGIGRNNSRLKVRRNYRPGLFERMKRAVRDGLVWLAWKTAKYGSVLLLGAALNQNSDKIGEALKDRVSKFFNSGAAATALQPPAPQSETHLPPPAVKPEDTTKYRDGMISEDIKPTPKIPPAEENSPPPAPIQEPQKISPSPLKDAFARIWDALKPTVTPYWTKNEMIKEITRLTENDPIPKELMVALTQSESSFNINARSVSNALGPAQFIPSTQLEYMYKCKDMLPAPYNALARAIYKNADGEYKVGITGDKSALISAARDPAVAFILQREFLRSIITEGKGSFRELLRDKISQLETQEKILVAKKKYKPAKERASRIAVLKEQSARRMTFADAKTFYLFGARGGAEFLAAYADPGTRHERAIDHVSSSAARYNPDVVYLNVSKKISRDVNGLHSYLQNTMGGHASKTLPENLERLGSRIAAEMHDGAPKFHPV